MKYIGPFGRIDHFIFQIENKIAGNNFWVCWIIYGDMKIEGRPMDIWSGEEFNFRSMWPQVVDCLKEPFWKIVNWESLKE